MLDTAKLTVFLIMAIVAQVATLSSDQYMLSYVNKTYELFKESSNNLIVQNESSLKLKCALTVAAATGQPARVRWFKLDSSLNIIKEFQTVNTSSDDDEDDDASSIHVLGQHQQVVASKINSTLVFKNVRDLASISGFYLCRVYHNETNDTLHKTHEDQQQYIQRIIVNELEAIADTLLNYSIVQVTTGRVILNLSWSKETTVVDHNSRLIYSLVNPHSGMPKLKGTINLAEQGGHSVAKTKHFLVLEGLSPNTRYQLLVYLQTRPSRPVHLVLNATISSAGVPTPITPSVNSSLVFKQANHNKLNEDDDYYTDEEEIVYDAEDGDDDSHGSKKRIVGCDLKSIESTLSRSSELDEKEEEQDSPQFININYYSSNMANLLNLILNRSNMSQEYSMNLRYFVDKFNLINFNKNTPPDTMAHSVNTDCIRQHKEARLTFTEPLCSLDFETSTEFYDSYRRIDLSGQDDTVTQHHKRDLYSVHTSLFIVNHMTPVSVNIASGCSKQKRHIRNSVIGNLLSGGLLDSSASSSIESSASTELYTDTNAAVVHNGRFNSVFKTNVIDLHNLKPNTKNVTHVHVNNLDKKLSLITLNTPSSSSLPLSSSPPATKSTTTSTPNKSTNYKLDGKPVVDNCVVMNESELKFKLESNLNEYARVISSEMKNIFQYNGGNNNNNTNSSTFINSTHNTSPGSAKYVYEIEILVSKSTMRTLATYYTYLTKIRMGAENGVQIVRINLTNKNNHTYKILNKTVRQQVSRKDKRENSNHYHVKRHRLSDAETLKLITDHVTRRAQAVVQASNSTTSPVGHYFVTSSRQPDLVDYLFKIKLLNSNNTKLDDFDLSVQCTRMNTNSNTIDSVSLNDADNSFFGFIMTLACAAIIIIVGFLICLIMKRKYGLTSDHFMSFKSHFPFKLALPPSRQNSDPNIHNKLAHHHHLQKYQLPISQITNTTITGSPVVNSSYLVGSKAPSYSYVRLLKQKWSNLSHSVTGGGGGSSSESSQEPMSIHLDFTTQNPAVVGSRSEASTLKSKFKRRTTRPQFYLTRLRSLMQGSPSPSPPTLPVDEKKMDYFCGNGGNSSLGESSAESSSTSSSPLVLTGVQATQTTTDNHVDDKSEPNGLNLISYYSSNFTSSIKARINSIKRPVSVYKDDSDAIGVDVFDAYVQRMHHDGDFGFAQLYEEITAATKSLKYTSDVSQFVSNRCKNRYTNILTYDHSRVKLSHDEKDPSLGYINANYVDGYFKPNAYIATQGPLTNTMYDFWRMIYEKNCNIIVMITNVKEKGRIKCDQYWPEEGAEQTYENLQVTHLQTLCLAFYTRRCFSLKVLGVKKRHTAEMRVYQYHFTDWPDHGVPYYILPVLTFIKKSSRANPETAGPIVVHCSAGVGRTGTYIVIDSMMQQISHRGTINVHTFLKHIRHQRNYLVQTEEQFIFIYDVLLESLKSGECELTELNYRPYIENLSRVFAINGLRLIDRQFQLITEFKPNEYQVSAALMQFNTPKNRGLILPVNNSRVILSRLDIDGSEYINATYLHGCCRQDEFIVTQHPLEETKCSFWQMVWDNNVSQLVVLNSDDTTDCGAFWQPVGEPMNCNSFTVLLKEENFDIDFIVRDFLLQSIDEDYEFNCRMITASYWPDSCTPIRTTFDLINKVKAYRIQNMATTLQLVGTRNMMMKNRNIMITNGINSAVSCNSNSPYSNNIPPIVVLDLYGGWRAASFCALYTFQDAIQLESSVNVYETAKLYHLKRPGIWANKNNIMFLYEAVGYLFETSRQINPVNGKTLDNSLVPAQSATLPQISHNIGSSSSPTSLNYQYHHQRNYSLTGSPPYPGHLTSPFVTDSASIGARLHNFQNYIQQNRSNDARVGVVEPSTAIPLNSIPGDGNSELVVKAKSTNKSKLQTVNSSIRRNIADLPKLLRKNMMISSNTGKTDSANITTNVINEKSATTTPTTVSTMIAATPTPGRVQNNGIYRNNKALRLMASMKLKSTSFKRTLFAQSDTSEKRQVKSELSYMESENVVVGPVKNSSSLDPKPSLLLSMPLNKDPMDVESRVIDVNDSTNNINQIPSNSSSSPTASSSASTTPSTS